MNARGSVWYQFIRGLARWVIFPILGGFKSVGEERVPWEGPVLIAPIHLSHLDPPAVACGHPRVVRTMAKSELFKIPIMGPFIRTIGAFPVKRGEGDAEAIRASLGVLEAGGALVIFPEGTRGDGVTMGTISPGLAVLARRTNALVIPVAIVGSHLVLGRGSKRIRRHRVTVAYGQPFRYAEIATAATERANRDLFATELAKRIAATCSENGLEVKISPSNQSSEESDPVGTSTEA